MPVWNRQNAKHLLSRTLFGFSRKELSVALSYPSAEAFIDQELLADLPTPPAIATWVTEIPVANDPNIGTRNRELAAWWSNLMLTEKTSMREKMVMFFHNHFTSQRSKVNYPQFMYIQNALFRKYAFGDFRQLTKDITVDPAMLIYLDGRNSSRTGPNENYGRELLELFTLGEGNYTETDIKQAAKALTGWRVTGLDAVFDANRFDTTNKTFLGKTGNFGYKEIVDIIFQQNATATFLCRKLYKEFVFYKPDEVFIAKMAKVMRDNNFNLKPVLKFMLFSDEFYQSQVIASRIKSPTELMIGSLKDLDVPSLTANDWGYLYDTGRNLQQWLFEPPDVNGWEGQRNWISSNTYPQRGGFSDSLINGRRATGAAINLKIKPLDFARSYASAENASAFVDDVIADFLMFPPSDKRRNQLLATLLDGTILANWSTFTPMADVRIGKFLKALMRLPEFQLV